MLKKSYGVSIVGESHYQKAVKATKEGEYVDLLIEIDNPYAQAGKALRVDNLDGDTVGYIPEDNWLYRAIIDEGKGCLARVDFKGGRPAGLRLEVQLGDTEISTVSYGERGPSAPSGCAASFLIATLLPIIPWLGSPA